LEGGGKMLAQIAAFSTDRRRAREHGAEITAL
jgi:hypothetical protein